MTDSLREPGPLHGVWSATAHQAVVELASSLEPDFLCLDAQHGTHLSRLTPDLFTTMAHYGVPGLVRVAENDPVDIGRALDLGAAGFMAPMIETAKHAGAAVAAGSYLPSGIRSFGMQTPRIDSLAPSYRPICAVQIETAAAIDNIEEIAAVDGVDWLYIGPADLGLALGGIPAPDVVSVFNHSHPLAERMLAAFQAVVKAATVYGKLAGLHCGSGRAARLAEDHGFRVASVATDLAEMRAGMANHLRTARGAD